MTAEEISEIAATESAQGPAIAKIVAALACRFASIPVNDLGRRRLEWEVASARRALRRNLSFENAASGFNIPDAGVDRMARAVVDEALARAARGDVAFARVLVNR